MGTDGRTPLIVVGGWGVDTELVARKLLQPKTVVVHHQLRQLGEGVVIRHLHSSERTDAAILELAHGCVSCTLREDLLPLLRRLSRRSNVDRIVLALDPVLEPEAVCWAIDNVIVAGVVGQLDGPASRDVRVEAVVTCVDAVSWMDDATGDDEITDRGLLNGTDDDRTVAQVVVNQAEFADALVVVGEPDPLDRAQLEAVMRRLAPAAVQQWVHSACDTEPELLLRRLSSGRRRGVVDDAHAPLLRGGPTLTWEFGVGLIEFSADRPFHPARLHEAIDVLVNGVLRVKGRLWLATQPSRVMRMESAGGGLRMFDGGLWLVSMSPEELEHQPVDRRLFAALRWHPRFGDRDVSLAIIVHNANPSEIERTLRWALVTDDELLAQEQWPQWPDPFGEFHKDPCETSESPHAESARKDQA